MNIGKIVAVLTALAAAGAALWAAYERHPAWVLVAGMCVALAAAWKEAK